ncbi:hypothetical protein HYFRA_00013317 [Hymenoscyphus fraxineus]|uniref:General negative regulator of transcription subunit 1 n=1 Tax=Hymenoscyphus fraxineus TaxID=746836 RepID=A0A9N9LA09_9HELO|nr:hypothetical protein HYFRA_00013317 [Hymenoscyphus fraxineus]
MVNSRGGTFTPSPAHQTIVTGVSHSPQGSHHSAFSASASPSTNSPTGSNSLTKIVVAQVYLLLSTIKKDKDLTKWEEKAEQIRKLMDEHGMEVYNKGITRLVVGNAGRIFPGVNRPPSNPDNYDILWEHVHEITKDVDQAGKLAEAIESGNEDIFRDFDLSTFMQHFKLDALEKTILALAFKTGSRPDLKTKSDAILSANYSEFTKILSQPEPRRDLPPAFLATIIDRLIQEHPPSFDQTARKELGMAISYRYAALDLATPTEVLAALYLSHCLSKENSLALYIKRRGSAMTSDEETCRSYLHDRGNVDLSEEQVAAALIYASISQTPTFSVSILVSSLRREVSRTFRWSNVVKYFDKPLLRITPRQFLALYSALRPLAEEESLDIQSLWGGKWVNSETQLSFIGAFLSLSPEDLDATTIPNLQFSFTLEEFTGTDTEIHAHAARAVRHPLVSAVALTALFSVALEHQASSETTEAKRLFQGVVVPNLDIFLVSAFGVEKPWPEIAVDTINTLFDRFLYKYDPNYDFVLEGLWRKDKQWVAERLIDAHAKLPTELSTILDHAVRHNWLGDLVLILSGFGLDLTALAHARGRLDLDTWALSHQGHNEILAKSLITFLNIKARHELEFQRSEGSQLVSVMLPVKTIFALLIILREVLPKTPDAEVILVQRACITAYPRLINYGADKDAIIDANGRNSNSLPKEANERMEDHYKRMYNQEQQVKSVVLKLTDYKNSDDPADQDTFACMIHGLFDEYSLYSTYPLEALATTAVLFGGIIQHRLINDIPLEIGLGMILEAVRDHDPPNDPMYKFGLQALMQLGGRLAEWPGFCNQLLAIPGLRNTPLWTTVYEITEKLQEDARHSADGGQHQLMNGGALTNGNVDDMVENTCTPFSALWVDESYNANYQAPSSDIQEKIQFVMNNITGENLHEKFEELEKLVEEDNQQWFASLLVEQRAKREANNHRQYMELVRLIGRKSLYSEILKETYISAFRLLNSEAIAQSANDRILLQNLATWLGMLTLARDKPIKHQNIAFKQLLMEAYDTKRLPTVIPFVCKVLVQGKNSTVFKPPNPWIMDIIQLLMEIYHHAPPAELKLNQKFAIEVLCSDLEVDRESIETNGEILNRAPVEEATNVMAEVIEGYENMSMNGIAPGLGSGRFSPEQIARSLPDLGPDLSLPPANDMVNQPRLHEILRTAITRAVAEIISPVVERSVTIAAISTAQMIHKDFATEPNEERVRAAAINMVKKTAGSLALVTSKEPLRASMTNYIRSTSGELSQGLPEGTIIMCVNSNLELACRQVENKAEERAVPEIEEMMENELEKRRIHRQMRPDEPYYDPNELSRWSWTIPAPYKLQPSMGGLNEQQMAIYDEFARQPRPQSLPGTTHVASASDATRSMANDILQDQYAAVPHLPAPAEPAPMPHITNHQVPYAQPNPSMVNGRLPVIPQMDARSLLEKFENTLLELKRVTSEAPERHYKDLGRPNQVHDVFDNMCNSIFKCLNSPADLDILMVDQLCGFLFSGLTQDLLVECLVVALKQIIQLGNKFTNRIALRIGQQPGEALINVPLAAALIEVGMLEWQRVDSATSKAILLRKVEALEFLMAMVDKFMCTDNPSALYTDLARSLEVAWLWIEEEPTMEIGQQLKQSMKTSGIPQLANRVADDRLSVRQNQMEYVFDEWIHLYNNPNASEKASAEFISQMYRNQLINDRDDLCIFLRISLDSAVEKFDQMLHITTNEAYIPIDALAKLVVRLVKRPEDDGEVKNDRAAYLGTILSLTVLVLNHHHLMRGEAFNQRVFSRFFSTMLGGLKPVDGDVLSDEEYHNILLTVSHNLLKIQPINFPGFLFAWLALVSHRDFMPIILGIPNQAGWETFTTLMESLMVYAGELFKPLHLTELAKRLYGGLLKILVVLQHDFPEYVAANHSRLCANIPSHCIQLLNVILNANPAPYSKFPDPLQPGLKIDRIEEIRESPTILNDVEATLQQSGLLDVLDQALHNGPSEDAVAHIAHAIQRNTGGQSGLGFVPINVDRKLVEAIVIYVGIQSIARATQNVAPTFVSGSPDAALLTMLVHELHPEARYYLLSSIADQLRFPNTHTHYFSQALLEVFGNDMNDQEESDIRQQITRVLLERMAGQWPQPWGLIVTIHELVKNDKYMFFELPFIKSATPDVADRFSAIAARPYSTI